MPFSVAGRAVAGEDPVRAVQGPGYFGGGRREAGTGNGAAEGIVEPNLIR